MSRSRSDKITFTRRHYLTLKAMEAGAGLFLASEAVATTAIEHPEWDLTERKTWEEWEAES